jgi:hypothetical protein
VNGNGGTNPSTNFLGTTDNQPLVVKTNNVEALRVTTTGSVGIGISNPSPSAKLTVNGSISATGGTFTNPINASITGTAGTVTNGVYTTGSYADPAWITSLAGSKVSGTVANATHAASADSATMATNFTGALSGDVTGSQGSTTVTALRGVPLSSSAPTMGQVLTYNGTAWAPAAASSVSSAAPPPLVCPGCELFAANLPGANLVEAYLGQSRDGIDTDLTGADLTGADLTGATLINANLSSATLINANLTDANLKVAVLFNADLRGANLTGADLFEASLENANLFDANLTNAQLGSAVGGTSVLSIAGVTWSHTGCPDGTDSNTNGTSPASCVGHGF